jgi:hypothetical protein
VPGFQQVSADGSPVREAAQEREPVGQSAYEEARGEVTPEPVERSDDGVHPLVEETMERLDGLRELPVGEHAEVYAELHERLQAALVEADAEPGDRG